MTEAQNSILLRSSQYRQSQATHPALLKPNLFVIGSMKSGTTLLWRLLKSHPAIHMSTPQEPSYFVEPNQLRALDPRLWNQGYWQNQDAYLDLFKAGLRKTYIGEASSYYTHLPLVTGVADRIMRFNPKARLIYIMRDPIERAIGHYWHRVIFSNEYRSMETAIKTDSQYRDVSNYALQLGEYYKRFDKSQIKVLTLEQVFNHYDDTTKMLFKWLNLSDTSQIRKIDGENELPNTVRRRMEFWGRAVDLLKRVPASQESIDRLPESMRSYTKRLFTREINRSDLDTGPVAEYLRPLQLEQTKALSALTGREYPEWKTLYS
jgi:hypothetical protein